MNHSDSPAERTRDDLPNMNCEVLPQKRNRFFKRISTENPFYLLSAAFVIHSTGLSIGGELALPILLSLVGGYLLLLAIVGMAIVRFWNVWDDARSIFLILILLMLELALCFDSPLTTKELSPIYGLLGVTAASLLLSELVVRFLKIRLPWVYRGPFYLQLSLATLAALIPLSVTSEEDGNIVRWAIYGVSLLAGVSMLTLIPAIRTSRDRVEISACPWIWPYHPWALFVIVWLCIGFRLYLLTISFDPVMELGSFDAYDGMGGIFGGYLIAPMLWGLACLMLAGAVVHRHWFIHSLALSLPMICIAISVRPYYPNLAYAQFYSEFSNVIGSPVWVSTLFGATLFAIGWANKIALSRRCLVLSLLMLSRIGDQTIHWQSLTEVNLAWVVGASVILLLVGLWRWKSRFLVEAATWLTLSFGANDAFVGWEMTSIEIQLHLIALAIVVVSFWIHDDAMDEFKVLLIRFFVVAGIRMLHHSILGIREPAFASIYLVSLTSTALVLNIVHPKQGFLMLSGFLGTLSYASGFVEGGRFLNQQVHWNGLRHFLIGVALLHIGVLSSAWKGGFFQRWFPPVELNPPATSSDSPLTQ